MNNCLIGAAIFFIAAIGLIVIDNKLTKKKNHSNEASLLGEISEFLVMVSTFLAMFGIM